MEETALRRACYAALGDDAPWGVYADWLRERGRETMADRLPVLRELLTRRLPVAMRVAEFADDLLQ